MVIEVYLHVNTTASTHPPTHPHPQAEQKIFNKNENKEYLVIEGLDTFRKATVDLLLGSSSTLVAEVGWGGG